MSDSLQPVDLSAYLSQPSEAERQFRRLFPPDEPMTIFDVGACEGEDSVRYAHLWPRARVLAFEPLPANQPILMVNFQRYRALNARLVPLALSDRTGPATFYVSSGRPPALFAGENWNYGNKSSSLLPPVSSAPMHGWIEFKEAITVNTITLDEFCAKEGIEHIDFMQVDVQGAEQKMLTGARAMLPHIGAIWLEVAQRQHYKGQPLDRDISRFMRQHGFVLAFEAHLGDVTGEGDHLYLNRRHMRTWTFLAHQAIHTALRRFRPTAGRIRRAFRRTT